MPRYIFHNPTASDVQIPGTSYWVRSGENLQIDIQAASLDTPDVQKVIKKGLLRLSPVVESPHIANGIEIPTVEIHESGGGGTGITEGEHEDLHTLTHELASSFQTEYTYTGGKLTSYIVWNAGHTLKIRDAAFTYSGSKLTGAVMKQYDTGGILSTTLSKVFTYSGSNLTGVAATRS